jgi:hypothetical protein
MIMINQIYYYISSIISYYYYYSIAWIPRVKRSWWKRCGMSVSVMLSLIGDKFHWFATIWYVTGASPGLFLEYTIYWVSDDDDGGGCWDDGCS